MSAAGRQLKTNFAVRSRRYHPDKGLKLGAFIIPAVAIIIMFFGIPLALTVIMSFFNWPLSGPKTFVGLANYSQAFTDSQFWQALGYTLLYTVVVTPPIFILAFIMTLLTERPLRGMAVFRSIYFLPFVISMVAASLIWLNMYNNPFGIIDYILTSLHIISHPISWISSGAMSTVSVIIMIVWKTAGFTMMILIAGMQGIPEEVMEAASVDGATYFRRLIYVVIPLLRRYVVLALVISVIGSFLGFDQFFVMTNGGPSNATTTIVFWIFLNAFSYFHTGYASAMSVILLIILMAITVAELKLLGGLED